MNPTLFARITGPGNVPEASVALKYDVHWIRHRIEQQLRRLTGESTHQELIACWLCQERY
jgi:hypothetical protein